MRPFTITRAVDADTALQDLVGGRGESRFVAGGTNLVDLMKTGVEAPDHLVDISRLDLAKIEELPGGKGVRIGALVRNSDLAAHPLIVEHYRVLSQAILAGASAQLRNMATTGGNLCSGRGVIISTTRCFRSATSAAPAAAAGPSTALTAFAASLARANRASRRTRATCAWHWRRSTPSCRYAPAEGNAPFPSPTSTGCPANTRNTKRTWNPAN